MPLTVTRRRFDVDDYHRMVTAGILSERDRVELIDGEIVTMTPIGSRHNAIVDRATRALVTAVGDRAIVRVQGSVRLGQYFEPEPDVVLLASRNDFYASQLPGPSDILLVIEIADSSLDYDDKVKTPIYAQFAISEYWLVDVERRALMRHTEPRGGTYETTRECRSDETIAPERLPDCRIPVGTFMVG